MFNVDSGDVPAGERGFPNDPTKRDWWRERTLVSIELAGRLGLSLTLKLIMPEAIRDNALNLLQAHGFSASRNGIGLRVAVLPAAKMAPLHVLWAEQIEVNNFEIENSAEQ